ncbi:MAG: exopolysaccharide biosynthesis protein [Acidobacteria bacterium]|nr:exopolysaccharide biosynthesis protein [Acidobacteriota bacterium]
MIDLHTHILWGIDDGPESFDDSLAMVELAAAAGTTDIVATPHANTDYSFDAGLVDERIRELSEAVGGAIRIRRGCDFHLKYDLIEDALIDPAKYTINRRRYLLVELSTLTIFNTTGRDLGRLRGAGMLPVITHPERNPLLQQRFELLERWVAEGCYLQVTADSYLGRWGNTAQKFCEQLTEAGLVHFVATDAHGVRDRAPDLRAARRHLARRYGEKLAAELLVINPQAALAGDPVPARTSEPPRKRSWWRFA